MTALRARPPTPSHRKNGQPMTEDTPATEPDVEAFRAARRDPDSVGDDTDPEIDALRVTPDNPVRALRRNPTTTEGTL